MSEPSSTSAGRGPTIARWVARLIVAAILLMAAIPKLTGQASALDELLPGGYAMVLAIGAVELATAILVLVPATALAGSVLAALTMLGALGSHFVGPVGTTGEVGGMWPLAVIVLVAAVAAGFLQWQARGVPPTP